MISFILNPFDVLFFGSGKPFNIGSQDTISIFPPFPHTLASSICSAVYHHKGIDVDQILKSVYGSFLEYKGKVYFPKPLDILNKKRRGK